MKPPADDEDDDYDKYDNDAFEESKHGGSIQKESAKAADLGYNFTSGQGKPAKFGLDEDQDVKQSRQMYSELKARYEEVQEQADDQEKTINF